MSLISIVFWALVIVTALVALRWGAMIGLIGFVFALLIGAVVVSRLAPPKSGVGAEQPLMSESRLWLARGEVSSIAEKGSPLNARAPRASAPASFPTRP